MAVSPGRVRQIGRRIGTAEVVAILLLVGTPGDWGGKTLTEVVVSILVLAIFGAILLIPWLLYGRFVDSLVASVVGGVGLTAMYGMWIGVAGTRLSTSDDLMLMQPLALAFVGLLLVMLVILADGLLSWSSSRRNVAPLPEADNPTPSAQASDEGSSS